MSFIHILLLLYFCYLDRFPKNLSPTGSNFPKGKTARAFCEHHVEKFTADDQAGMPTYLLFSMVNQLPNNRLMEAGMRK